MTNTTDDVQISTNLEAPVEAPAMPSTLKGTSNTNTEHHSLENILERFVVVDNIEWTSSAPLLPIFLALTTYMSNSISYLKSYSFPQAILDNSAIIRQKINNFMLMRSDIEIELKVNSNPFQQGELTMAYFPKTVNTSRFRAQGNEFMASVTSAPHKILKLEQSNTMKMTIPYANILEQIELTDVLNAFGEVRIYVSSPLRGPADVERADITVRARFVNPVLTVPTDNSLLTTEYYQQIESQALERAKKRAQHTTRTPFQLHAQMAEGEQTGPVSRIANTIAYIGDALQPLPLVGKVAEVTSWIARGVSGVASVFGWSKPIDIVMPTQTSPKTAAYMGNTEGKDTSHVLAQIPDNAIDSTCMVPSGKDELALSSIFSRVSTIGRYTVPKLLFRDRNLLFSWEASPFNVLTQQTDSNGQDLALSAFSYASMMAKYWRGSILYSLRMVKTQYHSGRVVAVYFPNRTRSELPAKLTEELTTNVHTIIDLNPKSENDQSLEKPLKVPYTSAKPWLKTLWKFPGTELYDSSTLETCCGCVGVYVYNDLVCPDTVAQEVTFLLSVKAGEDYQIAVPQIQLQAGFAQVVQQNPSAEVVNVLQESYNVALTTAIGFTDGTPNQFLASDSSIAIDQSGNSALWKLAEGKTINLSDGIYDVDIFLTPTIIDTLFAAGVRSFKCTVLDGLVERISSDALILLRDCAGNSEGSMRWEFAEPIRNRDFRGYRAQMDDVGGSEPIPSDEFLAPVHARTDVSHSTTGEYFVSLRPLLKRFCKTCRLDLTTPISMTPAAFQNYDTEDPVFPVGNRTWGSKTQGGGLLKESWLSLISYLFRFSSGSVRTKLFIGFNDEIQTSLDISSELEVEFGKTQFDPIFVTNGVINNAVETHVPYYSQYKARVIGDQLRGGGAKITYQSKNPGQFDYFEAAGDDYNMWFMVGVPVMRPFDVEPTPLNTIAPASTVV